MQLILVLIHDVLESAHSPRSRTLTSRERSRTSQIVRRYLRTGAITADGLRDIAMPPEPHTLVDFFVQRREA